MSDLRLLKMLRGRLNQNQPDSWKIKNYLKSVSRKLDVLSSIINAVDEKSGKKPIHYASELGDVEILNLIISYELLVNSQEKKISLQHYHYNFLYKLSQDFEKLHNVLFRMDAHIRSFIFSYNLIDGFFKDRLERLASPLIVVIGYQDSLSQNILNLLLGYEQANINFGFALAEDWSRQFNILYLAPSILGKSLPLNRSLLLSYFSDKLFQVRAILLLCPEKIILEENFNAFHDICEKSGCFFSDSSKNLYLVVTERTVGASMTLIYSKLSNLGKKMISSNKSGSMYFIKSLYILHYNGPGVRFEQVKFDDDLSFFKNKLTMMLDYSVERCFIDYQLITDNFISQMGTLIKNNNLFKNDLSRYILLNEYGLVDKKVSKNINQIRLLLDKNELIIASWRYFLLKLIGINEIYKNDLISNEKKDRFSDLIAKIVSVL